MPKTSLHVFKAKDTRFVADWLKSKGLHKLFSVFEGIQEPFIAFVKERFHNAVEIDILGIFEGFLSLQIGPPQKIIQGRNYSGRMT